MTAQHFLVPHDFSPYADEALEYAIKLAKTLQARLTLLHVIHVGDIVASLEAYVAYLETEAQERLQDVLARVHQMGLQGDTVIVHGVPFLTIVDIARDKHVDLIVMGTHGRTALLHVLIGSVAERVTRLAPCPVLVTRAHKESREPLFLVPLDFSTYADDALAYAMTLAQARHARLTLLHVQEHLPIGTGEISLPDTYNQEVLEAIENRMADYLTRVQDVGLKGNIAILRGDPLQHILDVAHTQHVDLIVMGTHGLTGFEHSLLGSVAENVVRLARCPVLVAHHRKDVVDGEFDRAS